MAANAGDEYGPKKVVIVSMSGASHSEHDTDIPGAERDSVRAGHEPDRFAAKAILAVPALLTLVVLTAFGVVTFLYRTGYTRFHPAPAGGFNPQAVAFNTTLAADGKERIDRDVSSRVSRISSTAPKDVNGLPGTAVPQPRLEYLKETAPESKDDPAYLRTKRPIETPSNTYEIRPEDLRPDNYADPETKVKMLATYGWLDTNKKVARIPINDAIKMVIAGKKLPARKDAVPSPTSTTYAPTLANGGVPPQRKVIQPAPPTDNKSHDDKKAGKH